MGGVTHRTSLPQLGHTYLDNRFRENVSPARQDHDIRLQGINAISCGCPFDIKETPLKGHTFLSATSVGTNMTLAEGYLPRFLIHICSGALNLVLGSVVFTSRGCRAFPVAVTKLNSY